MAICSPEVNWRVVLGGIFHDIFSSLVHFRSKTPFDSGREYLTTLISCGRTRMSSRLLKRIFRWLCPHRLSWPHSGTHGQDYQVCLLCGTAYEYDWTTMRRTGRLIAPEEAVGQRQPP